MKVLEMNAHNRIINVFLAKCGEDKDIEEYFKDYTLLDFFRIGLGQKTAIQAYCIVQSILKGKSKQLPYCIIDFKSNQCNSMIRKPNTAINLDNLCKDIELLIKEKYNEDVIIFNGNEIKR